MITGSIVLFKPQVSEIENVIKSCLNHHLTLTLYLIDNSPLEEFKKSYSINERVIYIHNPSNPGFGTAHNIAIKKAIESGSKYHFIINPDVRIKEVVFTPITEYTEANPDVGMLMPKILNEDGTAQNLPKLLPHHAWIFR